MVVVAAIDHSEEAQVVIDEARALAGAFEEPLHVVHAISSTDFAELQREFVSSTADEEGVLERDEIAAEIAADVVDETTVEIVGLEGEPAPSIVDYAEEVDARFIVLGGRDRSPAGKAVFGSTTQSVLLETDRPTVVAHLDR